MAARGITTGESLSINSKQWTVRVIITHYHRYYKLLPMATTCVIRTNTICTSGLFLVFCW